MQVSSLTAKQRNSETAKQRNSETAKQRNIFILTSIIILFFFLSENCSTFTPPAKYETIKSNQPNTEWYHYEASRRGAYVFRNGATVKLCAEPFPDVAKDILASIKITPETISVMSFGSASVTNTKKVSTDSSLNEKTVQLAGRTSQVLMIREMLYRLCELSINTDLTKGELKEMYNSVAYVAGKYTDIHLKEIEAEAQKLKIIEKQLEIEGKKIHTQETKNEK